jgi:hypothetical protein
MANEIIRNEFFNMVRAALESARSVSAIDHAGLRGEARENFVQELLIPILPPYVEFGSGKIVDSKNNSSAETDLIIYSRQTLPPLLFGSTGIYPVEACIYAIEVKSKLTAKEVQTTIEKFLKLRDLHYLPPALDEHYKAIGCSVPHVIPLLFAFDTDLAEDGKDELERYRELDPQADSDPMIPIFCVVGRGYWWFKQNEPTEKWIKHMPSENNEEVVDMIGGIANTIPQEVIAKGKPKFGNYVLENRDLFKL